MVLEQRGRYFQSTCDHPEVRLVVGDLFSSEKVFAAGNGVDFCLAFWSLPFVIHPTGIVITSAIEHDGLITTAIEHNGGRCLSFNIAMVFRSLA